MDMFSSADSAKNAVDMFPQTAQTRKRLWICSHKQKNSKDIHPIVSSHVETVVLMSKEVYDLKKCCKIASVSLRASAHAGVAIRSPWYRPICREYPEIRNVLVTDCRASDVGHWLAMTAFWGILRLWATGRISSGSGGWSFPPALRCDW